MFISMAQVVSFDNENDATEGVENIMIQGRAGTSVAASKIAGAALQVRDYLAKGYYPTGQPVASDRIPDVSGMLVKALLINSTDFASTGTLVSCTGKGPLLCSTEEGYGKVELANTLPLASYRLERRPANNTNVAPVPNVPRGLIVVDEYFDGGARGVGSDGSTTGIGVVPVGGSVSFDFYRRDGWDQLRASLAWFDAEGDLLKNDLDLEILSGDADIVANGDGSNVGIGNCLTNQIGDDGSLCGYCTIAANDPGAAGYFNPTNNNPFLLIWKGNQSRQFSGQFTLRAECDQITGVMSTNLSAYPQNGTDTRNTTEQVALHYFGDPQGFGASRGGGDHGFYRARVRFKNNASATPVPHAPAVECGAACATAPGGDDTVLARANGTSYIGTGADGLSNSTATGDDVQLIPNGSFGQPFGLAIAGGIYNDRVGSTVAFNRNVYNCSDSTVSLRVADGSRILGNLRQAETAANVNIRTRVEAVDPNGVVQDVEGGFTFSTCSAVSCDGVAAGVSSLRVGKQNHFLSNNRRLQFISDRPGAANAISNNGIIEAKNGWTLRAVYDDQSPTHPGGPVPEDAVTTAQVNCAPLMGPVMLFPAGGAGSGGPQRRTLISGGCDVGRGIGGRGDHYLDAGESLVYQVGFANQNLAAAIDLKATLSCADPVPGGADPCSFISPLPQAVSG
jgi:hypothetical protein